MDDRRGSRPGNPGGWINYANSITLNLVLSFGQTSGGISSTTGAWTGFVMVPSSATQLNKAFYNQGGTWDNNNGQNYNLIVS